MIAQLKTSLIQPALPGYDLLPVSKAKTRVILLRHGRSTLNDQGRYQGSSDNSELTAAGDAASETLGRYLAHCPIDAVYASPLKRAQQTVAALLPQLKVPPMRDVVTTPLLKEMHLPEWEGLQYTEVQSRFADLYHRWQTHPDQVQMQTVNAAGAAVSHHPVRDVYERSQEFWQSVLPHHAGQTILVVGHGSSNQALINTALNLPSSKHHALQQTHSGLTVLDVPTALDRAAHLHLLNATLSARLPKLKAGKQGLRLLLLPCGDYRADAKAITALLENETVHAAIIEDPAASAHRPALPPIVADQILQNHPETIRLAVQQMQLSQYWQAAIQRSLTTYDHDQLTTLLIVGQTATLQAGFSSLIQWPQQVANPQLQPYRLTTIHYPKAHPRPILQGFNLVPLPPPQI
ncbi:MAG: histidine phosphatase family protein [Cyanobacteria bacterium P01_D01_bin.71]